MSLSAAKEKTISQKEDENNEQEGSLNVHSAKFGNLTTIYTTFDRGYQGLNINMTTSKWVKTLLVA